MVREAPLKCSDEVGGCYREHPGQGVAAVFCRLNRFAISG